MSKAISASRAYFIRTGSWLYVIELSSKEEASRIGLPYPPILANFMDLADSSSFY